MTDRTVLGETNVTDANQITLLKAVRPHLKVKCHDRVRFMFEEGRVYIEKVKQ